MADQEAYSEKREFVRRKFTNRVAVLCRGQFSIEAGVEIGEGGMLLRARKHFAIGDEMELNFTVPGGGYVSGQGVVLYMLEPTLGEFYFGIRFLDPSLMLKLEVRQFVSSEKSPLDN